MKIIEILEDTTGLWWAKIEVWKNKSRVKGKWWKRMISDGEWVVRYATSKHPKYFHHWRWDDTGREVDYVMANRLTNQWEAERYLEERDERIGL